MTDHGQQHDETLRAAQETAVRKALGGDHIALDHAAEVVDAVLNAGEPTACPACVTQPHDEPERPHVHVTPYGYAIYAPEPERLPLVDQMRAAGYAAAVAELRGVAQRTGSPAARWAADYLEAVGPGTDETVREATEPAGVDADTSEPDSAAERDTATADEAERTYGHPLQYALVGPRARYVGNTEHLTDAEISPTSETIERYNRCPTCEQWAPCDVRKAETPRG